MKPFTILFTISFDQWPPPSISKITSHDADGCTYDIYGHPEGFIGISASEKSSTQYFTFSRLIFDGAANAINICLSSDTDKILLNVNGIFIPALPNPLSARSIIIKSMLGSTQTNIHSQPIAANSPDLATEAETLFIRNVCELDLAAKSDDWYVVLRASGVLRLLLLDGLLHKANARFHQKILFTTNNLKTTPPPNLSLPKIIWQRLSPDFGKPLHLGLDKFLAATVLSTNTTHASVRDMIQACANALGGVHFGPANNAKQEAIIELDKVHIIFGSKPSIESLRDICQIVKEALHPLVLRIQSLKK